MEYFYMLGAYGVYSAHKACADFYLHDEFGNLVEMDSYQRDQNIYWIINSIDNVYWED